nr:hypothetical protein GCM10025699_70010 [Microbacterium flavescens]
MTSGDPRIVGEEHPVDESDGEVQGGGIGEDTPEPGGRGVDGDVVRRPEPPTDGLDGLLREVGGAHIGHGPRICRTTVSTLGEWPTN